MSYRTTFYEDRTDFRHLNLDTISTDAGAICLFVGDTAKAVGIRLEGENVDRLIDALIEWRGSLEDAPTVEQPKAPVDFFTLMKVYSDDEGNIDRHRIPVIARRLSAFAKNTDVECAVDAERWRALMASQHMHYMGSAGFDFANKPGTEDRKLTNLIPVPKDGEYQHFGMEFWSQYGTDRSVVFDNNFERTLLTAYVDHQRELVAARIARDASFQAYKADMAKRDNDLMDEIEADMDSEDGRLS